MNDCRRIEPRLSWYINDALPAAEGRETAAHLSECAACRAELADLIRLRHAVRAATEEPPGPSETVWEAIVDATHGRSVARLDIGSLLLGFTLGAGLHGRSLPICGDVRIMGRTLPLFRYERRKRR